MNSALKGRQQSTCHGQLARDLSGRIFHAVSKPSREWLGFVLTGLQPVHGFHFPAACDASLPSRTFQFVASIAAAITLTCLPASAAEADTTPDLRTPDRPPAADNSVEAEMASFTIHKDFEVSLFADETLGIANPVAIQWDHRGRLWVLTTLAYAQLKPGETPNDKVIILEDSDADGTADQSTVFADGLDMSTGFALGNGGVYLAEGPDLVHLVDSNGDDVADKKTLLLTGFGTGDTHQNISNFIFDSGGFLYFSQGLHAFSTVETPWGVSRGERAGFWRFDPRTSRLDPFGFPGMVSANPCGIAIDRWGALFIKSNGPRLCFATPGLIPTTHPRELMQFAEVGATPGKSMGAEIVETAGQPGWLQQHALIAGYFARQVNALPLIEDGSGFKKVEPVNLMSADHPSFRPVDIRMGPDGGIYISDWFNPVINHYQVSLRHPHRDYDHGRIWKLRPKDLPPVEPPVLVDLAVDELFEHLRSPERWTRDQARRLITESDSNKATKLLSAWAKKLDPSSDADSHALVEAVGILEARGSVSPELLDHLQRSAEPRTSAVAARILSRSTENIDDADATERLSKLLRDPHPRPRLEAVIACANRAHAESLPLALTALDSEVDPFIDYALNQTVHALSEHWLPAARDGELSFAKPEHLAFALNAYGGEVSASIARQTLDNTDAETQLDAAARPAFLSILATTGTAEDLRRVLVDEAHADPTLLNSLVSSWAGRRLVPAKPFAPKLTELLQSKAPAVRLAAIQLAGLWKATELGDAIEKLAAAPATAPAERAAAIASLGSLRGKTAASKLVQIALAADSPVAIRIAALEALSLADLDTAATTATTLIQRPDAISVGIATILKPVFSKSGGAPALSKVLTDVDLKPAVARNIVGAMAGRGLTDAGLTARLNKILGIKDTNPADTNYDAERVQKLVAAVTAGDGDVDKGREVFQLTQLNCVACHQIDKVGGPIGPPLDTVGAGLPLDQIIESVLYPARQLKEGYFATAITTIDGQVHTGYVDEKLSNGANVWLRDTATQKLKPVSMHQLAKREEIGTLMPPGLTASLQEEQLVDLIAYLASLKG